MYISFHFEFIVLKLNKSVPIHFNVVDGAWAPWGAYSTCTLTCGDGTKVRRRTCTEPEPSNGGSDCAGSGTEIASCNEGACPSKK